MKPTQQKAQEIPLKMVGSNRYGRFSKISDETTYNMIISDDWLVPYAGYQKKITINDKGVGRAIYSSQRWNRMVVVIDNNVYSIGEELIPALLFQLNTNLGDVFIDENLASQIAICDGQDIWIWNWSTHSKTQVTLPTEGSPAKAIIPGYITYQDTYFITVNKESGSWFLSKQSDGTDWAWGSGSTPVTTTIQTKPDNAVAALRAPGRGNLLYVFGENVTELWNDYGLQLFPYQRNNSVSIDYGCLSATTIAAMDMTVAWLGINEKSGPVIMTSQGSDAVKISTDGIDYQLSRLIKPSSSYGFFFKQDGHLFYQLTFTDPKDNLTLVYDFNTQSFFTLTDEKMNFHIAQRVAFFNDTYYFVSIVDGNVYEISTKFTNYDYSTPAKTLIYEIPRIRICPPIRLKDSSRFMTSSLTFTIEQGNDQEFSGSYLTYITSEGGTVITSETVSPELGIFFQTEQVVNPYVPRIDMRLSKDGATTFGSYVSKDLNTLGDRKNRVVYWQLGASNDLTTQFRFWSLDRVIVADGVMNIYQ